MNSRIDPAPHPEDLDDEELYDLVMERFAESERLDADWVDAEVRDGHVTLTGRVGTEAEVQVADRIVFDLVGEDGYTNELVIDELHRGETGEEEEEGTEPGSQLSDTARHLDHDPDAEAEPTEDAGEATERGVPYIPPEGPYPEGDRSGERH